MKPLAFEQIEDFVAAEIAVPGTNSIKGLFTGLRIDRDTLPRGCFAYDLREGDNDVYSTIEPFVQVNHTGTVVTRREIPMLAGDSDNRYSPIEYFSIGDELTAGDWRRQYLK